MTTLAMQLQTAQRPVRSRTLVADEQLTLAGMSPYVVVEPAEPGERAPAVLAHERSFAAVRAHVIGEPARLGEPPRAVRTLVGPLAGVRPDVVAQRARLAETPTAVDADVQARFSSDARSERRVLARCSGAA